MKNRWKDLTAALLALVLAACLIACSCRDTYAAIRKEVSSTTGLDVSSCTVLEFSDSHGGFLGDGLSFVSLLFPAEQPPDETIEANGWIRLPLTKNLTVLAYGWQTENSSFSPYLITESGSLIFPEVENGYYYFFDRHSDATERRDDNQVLSRSSLNFTLAIYDADTHTLYYAALDT